MPNPASKQHLKSLFPRKPPAKYCSTIERTKGGERKILRLVFCVIHITFRKLDWLHTKGLSLDNAFLSLNSASRSICCTRLAVSPSISPTSLCVRIARCHSPDLFVARASLGFSLRRAAVRRRPPGSEELFIGWVNRQHDNALG